MPWMTHSTSNNRSTSSTSTTSTSGNNTVWKPDLYAQKFIPRWIQHINSLPARSCLSPAPPYVNFEDYAQTFLPQPLFLNAPSTSFLRRIQSTKFALDVQPGPQIPLQNLDMQNYYLHFSNLVIKERQELAEDLKQYNLYQTALEPMPAYGNDAFRLHVPGLQEYVPPVIPSIFVGDAVIIRAVYGGPMSGSFDGNEYVAYIHALDRREVSNLVSSVNIGICHTTNTKSTSEFNAPSFSTYELQRSILSTEYS